MKKLLLGAILLFSVVGFSQTIITSKPIPKAISISFIKTVGDSIRIVKCNDYHQIYNRTFYLTNKKDTVSISDVSIRYDLSEQLKKCVDFNTQNKSLVFTGWPIELMRVNTPKISWVSIRYEDTLSGKRYNYNMTIDKANELYQQITEILKEF